MTYALLGIAALLSVFLAVVLIRTAAFRPKEGPKASDDRVEFDRERAVDALGELVRCKTVSYRDPALEDNGEFEKLIGLLPGLYPNVFRVCDFRRMPDRGLLFHWKGRAEGDPAVLMAHYDVVPVSEEGWDRPPFGGVVEDGVLWGRGTLDTKVTFNGVLFAADHLIGEKFVPEHDVYFAFSGGEEVGGPGAVRMVDWFEEQGITPAFVLDEGGAVVEGVFPGVDAPCALIGVAEKGMMNVEYRTRSGGGHSSSPGAHTPVGILSRACCRMEDHPFPMHLTAPVAGMFDTLGRHSTFLYRMIFANLWCFRGVLDAICKKRGGELNALMRTTVAFTGMKGSPAANVIPPEATMVSNLRLNPMDTVNGALERIRRTVGDPSVELEVFQSMEASRISRTDTQGWDKVASAVASTWRGSIVSPYLMIQCTDSRHYGRISDRVYRFSAMDLTTAERAAIHGNNEGIRLDCLFRGVEFFIRLLRDC